LTFFLNISNNVFIVACHLKQNDHPTKQSLKFQFSNRGALHCALLVLKKSSSLLHWVLLYDEV